MSPQNETITCPCGTTFTVSPRAMSRFYEVRGVPLPTECENCRRRDERARQQENAARELSPLSRDVHELRLQLRARDAEIERMRGTVDAMEQRVRLAQAEAAALRTARDAALKVSVWGGARREGPNVETR